MRKTFYSLLLFWGILLFSFSQNVGIGISAPGSKLSVKGNLAVGNIYSSLTAPANGAIIEGSVGIGTSSPQEKLHIMGNIRGNQLGAVRISTGFGYVDIGPKNTNWAHIITDKPRFYFNKPLWIKTGIVSSYSGEDLLLQSSGNTRIKITQSTGNVGIGNNVTADNSAKLEIRSSNSGLLIPRITTDQRDAISSPAPSLLIFNTTTNCYEWWDAIGQKWVSMSCGCSVPSPSAPTATSATNITVSAFQANWTPASGATYYELDVATDSGFTQFVPGYVHHNVGNVTSYQVNVSGCVYYYRVRAVNDCGKSAFSNIIKVTASSSLSGTQTFSSDGSFTVPCGVTSINVKVWGAGGGGSTGGGGGYVGGTIPVTPGEVLTIRVGQGGEKAGPNSYGNGGNGYGAGGNGTTASYTRIDWGTIFVYSSGGGGGSAILRGSTPLIVAGGGGGSGNVIGGGAGGAAGQDGSGMGAGQAGANTSINGQNAMGASASGPGGGFATAGGGGGGGKNGGTAGASTAGSGGSGNNGSSGGGGGNSWINTGAGVTGTIQYGTGTTPGNASDPALPVGKAVGGNGTNGGDGYVIISW